MDFIDIFTSIIALIILETVLGIDNLVILSILTEKLPVHKRKRLVNGDLPLPGFHDYFYCHLQCI